MLIGYMRPFQDDINCEMQLEELMKVPCDTIFSEEHSSPKRRIVLEKVFAELQPGDTIVVSRLYSLADSTRHLVELLDQLNNQHSFFYALHEKLDSREKTGKLFYHHTRALLEFQSDITSENTRRGMYEAKEKGMKLGRPRKLDENVKRAISMYESKIYSLAQIREETGISKTTLYRYLDH
jgi:DNA invertase Pin-like site-specific DNA recombinase